MGAKRLSAKNPPPKRSKKKTPEPSATARKRKPGGRLTPALQYQRDLLMVQRQAEGWTWKDIAAEAGITMDSAKKAVRALRESGIKHGIKDDPVKIIERYFEEFQLSVGGFEVIAVQALKENNLTAAVGAKRSANEAREKVLALLQMTGRMPQDLSALRHLIDLRAIAVRMLDVMDRFEEGMLRLELDSETKHAIDTGVLQVRRTFHELIGLGDDEDTDVVEGRELTT